MLLDHDLLALESDQLSNYGVFGLGLRTVVSSRQLAQRNPVYEYHEEALLAYDKMKDEIKKMILRYLMLSEVSYTDEGKLSIYFA